MGGAPMQADALGELSCAQVAVRGGERLQQIQRAPDGAHLGRRPVAERALNGRRLSHALSGRLMQW